MNTVAQIGCHSDFSLLNIKFYLVEHRIQKLPLGKRRPQLENVHVRFSSNLEKQVLRIEHEH